VIVASTRDAFRPLESSGEPAGSVRPLRQENPLSVDCVARPDGSVACWLL